MRIIINISEGGIKMLVFRISNLKTFILWHLRRCKNVTKFYKAMMVSIIILILTITYIIKYICFFMDLVHKIIIFILIHTIMLKNFMNLLNLN